MIQDTGTGARHTEELSNRMFREPQDIFITSVMNQGDRTIL